ncbi:hypothetical protein DVR12_12965 [Chitinophaga silvatica]|uniref:Uncharacterized protein n=1 Tax=Chitinophaga silvatica TaxID=2282649 RepID=A0A3E1YAK8_9BACT|nr:hypothetical protein [Chitinophaga silvatica]RFS22698.1 hypothetical protein DVR12_12965 [Chitinophaga silvatica]
MKKAICLLMLMTVFVFSWSSAQTIKKYKSTAQDSSSRQIERKGGDKQSKVSKASEVELNPQPLPPVAPDKNKNKQNNKKKKTM